MTKQLQISFTELEKLVWNSTLETFQQAMVEILCTYPAFLKERIASDRGHLSNLQAK